MQKSLILISRIFLILIGVFILMLGEIFVPEIRELFRGSLLFLLPFLIFSLLGAILVFLTIKKKIEGTLKKFLILTGLCAVGFFVSVFLHNAFYALGIITNRIMILSYLMNALNIIFFFVAIFICPLGFLLGIIGSMAVFIKKRKKM